jgi:hypothetical protein
MADSLIKDALEGTEQVSLLQPVQFPSIGQARDEHHADDSALDLQGDAAGAE